MIKVNMEKAREIHREYLRFLRMPLLAQLDVAFMRAVESGDQDKIAEISLKKQQLRDITDDSMIESAETPEELKLVIPEILKG